MYKTLTPLLKKKNHSRDNLGYTARKCLRNLMMTKNIIIKKADKGSVIVVENTTDYVQNGRGHLSDKSVYKRLDRDISMPIKSSIVQKLKHLYQAGKLNEEQYKYCLPLAGSKTARLYFLKKVHKNPPTGIRPIVSSCGSATENISQFVDICLQPMAKALPSYVRDSADFIEKIKSVKCPSTDIILSSWDIVSLYTNIPHKEGLEAVYAATKRQTHCSVKPKVLTELVKIVLKNNTITFAGEYYLQLQGTAMGTRLAPAYANVFMGELEKIWHSYVDEKCIIAWYRFIDDIFLIWNSSEEELDKWVQKCNQTHSLIKITYKKSSLETTFLDVTVFKGPKFRMTGFLD